MPIPTDKTLSEDFALWKNEIRSAMNDPDFPAESRLRLKKIFGANAGDELKVINDVQTTGLISDPEYLVWLLDLQNENGGSELDENEGGHAEGNASVHIVAQLKTITGEDFGLEPGQWRNWLATSRNGAESNGEKDTDPEPGPENEPNRNFEQTLAAIGPMDLAQDGIGSLVRLMIDENDNLVVDQTHWSDQFDNRTAEQVLESVKSLIAENNLPAGWFRPGGEYAIETTGLPQILFDSMAATIE